LKYVLCVFFVLAGLNHFINPAFYLKMMPPYLPWPRFLVYLSGVCEVALGGLLLVPALTRVAAWGLVALLVAVFPANVQMATSPQLYPDIHPLVLWLRLPLQAVLIAWAYWHTRPDGR
ncbi:MAG TPA: MauE/DoxX family redox-associated membrane protein, partial [Pyrinomonadaceae bacterium]